MRTLMLAVCLIASPVWADVDGSSLRCFTFTKAEVKQLLGIKKRTAFACANLTTGEIVGATLKNGVQSCPINGSFGLDGCAYITVCGVDYTLCGF